MSLAYRINKSHPHYPRRSLVRYVGKDGDGVPRVWAEHADRKRAWQMCVDAIEEYVKGRPDKAGDQWLILRDYRD